MDIIAHYPAFSPLSLTAIREVYRTLLALPDGVSEFTFGNIYFFRSFYSYEVSYLDEHCYIFRGNRNGEQFFFIPAGTVDAALIRSLFKTCSYWKLISESFIHNNQELFNCLGCTPEEDRNNFDYVYTQKALSTLAGKKLHKKKNHVNGFLQNYPNFSVKPLDVSTVQDAHTVLEYWANEQQHLADTDYKAAYEALDHLDSQMFLGSVLYVQNIPIAWCLAELSRNGTMAVVHFEKARTDFRGSYQYINYAFAQSLPPSVELINREQDLGDEGLRHAKMSYRPELFIKKYRLSQGALKTV